MALIPCERPNADSEGEKQRTDQSEECAHFSEARRSAAVKKSSRHVFYYTGKLTTHGSDVAAFCGDIPLISNGYPIVMVEKTAVKTSLGVVIPLAILS